MKSYCDIYAIYYLTTNYHQHNIALWEYFGDEEPTSDWQTKLMNIWMDRSDD